MNIRLLFFLVFLCALLLGYSSNVSAIGVTPASYNVDFNPHYKAAFAFTFIADDDMKIFYYVQGDLAQYVRLSSKSGTGTSEVVAYVDFPESIETPGIHYLFVGASQSSEGAQALGISGSPRGVIFVDVPYPGEYLEPTLKVTNANAGEPIDLALTLENKGKERVIARSEVDIYRGDIRLTTLSLDMVDLEPRKAVELTSRLETSDSITYVPGTYHAVARTTYGSDKKINASTSFRLGHLFVDISNYSDYFDKDKINRLEINVESFWNDPIDKVYANVSILGTNVNFATNPIGLASFEKSVLTGFFDTREIKSDVFSANITLYYGGGFTNKVVDLHMKREINYLLYSIIAGIAAMVALLLGIIVYMSRKLSTLKKRK